MARIPLIDPDDQDADPLAHTLLQAYAQAQPDSGALNVQKALANHPVVMQKLFELVDIAYLNNSLPDAKLRELPYLTSAVANNCFY
jgi:hypothetical protein